MKKIKIWAFIVFVIGLICLLGFLFWQLYAKEISPLLNNGETVSTNNNVITTSESQSDNENPISIANNLFENYFKDIIKNNNNSSETCSGNLYIYKTKIFNKTKDSFMAEISYESYVKTNGSEIITSSIFKLQAKKKSYSKEYVLENHGEALDSVKINKVDLVQKNELAVNPNVVNLPFLFKYNLATDTLSLSNNDGETFEALPVKLKDMINNYTVGSTINNLEELSNAKVMHTKNGVGIIYSKGKNVIFMYRNAKGNKNWIEKTLDFNEDNQTLMGNILDNGHGYIIGTSSVASGVSESMAYITCNGGESFKRFNIPSGRKYGILTAGSIPTSEIAVLGYSQGPTSGINLKRTTDGGATWKNINIQTEEYTNPTLIRINKDGVGVLDAEDGNGDQSFYKTNDFGSTWKANG